MIAQTTITPTAPMKSQKVSPDHELGRDESGGDDNAADGRNDDDEEGTVRLSRVLYHILTTLLMLHKC